jgi:competence protein ComEC
LLWAALAFAAGIAVGVHAWRPPIWWVIAWIVFTVSGAYLLRRRGRPAFIVGLGAIFFLGALMVQVHAPSDESSSGVLQFADGSEVIITAHVTKEGVSERDGPDSIRQRIEVETEQITKDNEDLGVKSGLRVNVYGQQSKIEPDQKATPTILFIYGERLRFPAKLSQPRNYRNPGAFDYREYLAENGIVALASTKAASIEVLSGFAGSRPELWRSRIHRSTIDKIHALWPPREAALMDAMVIGEDAFINRSTRADYQRSGTYHVLVVSGMNVSILALVTFWFLRSVRVSDLFAGIITVSLMVSYAFLTALGPPVWRADAGTLFRFTVLLSRKVDDERDWRGRAGSDDRESASIVRGEFSIDVSMRLAGSGCGYPHSGAHNAALPSRLKKYRFRFVRFCSACQSGAVPPGFANDCWPVATLCRPPDSLADFGWIVAVSSPRK